MIIKSNTEELNVLRQLFNNLSEQDQKAFLSSIFDKTHHPKSKIDSSVSPKVVKACPHCQSTKFVKNGTKDGTQRYLCRNCKKTFVALTGTILFHSKKPIETWKKYVQCMMEKYPLRKCAKICEIDLTTAFYWRHKILDALQNMMAKVKLDGIVQADETFTPVSYKGNHKKSNFKMPRQARHRGDKSVKAWLIQRAGLCALLC